MNSKPDFKLLRQERNKAIQERLEKIANEMGVNFSSLKTNYNPNACYCACSTGGPCEHQWDGETVELDGGVVASVTCSLCGCSSMSHDLKIFP